MNDEPFDVIGFMAEAIVKSLVVIGFGLLVAVPILLILSALGVVK